MMQLRISTDPTRLSMQTRPAALDLRSRRAQVQISAAPAQLNVQQSEIRLTVDNSACREARGLYSSAGFSDQMAQKGQQAAQTAVSQYVQTGNRLAQISSSANTVVQMIADSNPAQTQPVSIGWGFVPTPEVRFDVQPLAMNWSKPQLRYQAQPADVTGTYTRGEVDIQVAQYADIDIQVAEAQSAVHLFA
jgi:hypothetical protein